MGRVHHAVVAAVAFTGAIFTVSASSHAQSYAGTWASKPAQCKLGQESPDAPLILAARRYDQHEAHCEFASVKRSGSGWRVTGSCSVEGDKQKAAWTFRVTGDRLTIRDGSGARTLRRCG